MQVFFNLEVPKKTKQYIIARLLYGELRYYGSYNNKKYADSTAERLGNAVVINVGGGDLVN